MRWERAAHGGSAGRPGWRLAHACNAVRGGRLVYVFGGYLKGSGPTNLVHVYSSVTGTWSQPVVRGSPPSPRDGHSCTTVGENLFVFGGFGHLNLEHLKDLHILDTSSNTWISPTTRGEGPEARADHGAALVGKRLFVFGGWGNSSHDIRLSCYNDLYILNTETFVWEKAVTTGFLPSPRSNHTCSSWKNKIIVIAGNDLEHYFSDVHILDTDTLMWERLNTAGRILPPRTGHSTVSVGKMLFVFGGTFRGPNKPTDVHIAYDDLHMLDVETGLWTRVAATGDGPSPRYHLGGVSLDPFKPGVLAFIGGLCPTDLDIPDDVYLLHTGIGSGSAQSTTFSQNRLEKGKEMANTAEAEVLQLRDKVKFLEKELKAMQDKLESKAKAIGEYRTTLDRECSGALMHTLEAVAKEIGEKDPPVDGRMPGGSQDQDSSGSRSPSRR